MFRSLSRTFHKFVQRSAHEMVSRSAYASGEAIFWHGIEIVGKPEETAKISGALDWLMHCTPNSERQLAASVSTVLCVPDSGSSLAPSTVAPAVRAVYLGPSLVKNSSFQQIANCIMKASHHVVACEKTDKYPMRELSQL